MHCLETHALGYRYRTGEPVLQGLYLRVPQGGGRFRGARHDQRGDPHGERAAAPGGGRSLRSR